MLKDSGLELKLPNNHTELASNPLSETLSNITYKPEKLGLECSFPAGICIPLLELTDNVAGLCIFEPKGACDHKH